MPGGRRRASGWIRGEYLLFAVGMVMSPEMAAGRAAALDGAHAALAPWATGADVPQLRRGAVDPATLYAESDYARLRAIRATVDPAGRMVGNHPIPA